MKRVTIDEVPADGNVITARAVYKIESGKNVFTC